ncbi:MAG: hypothetical protein FWG53_07450 [Clostridiales bacterium]|nr:hypothetical protein [Clostridiales bacterium]
MSKKIRIAILTTACVIVVAGLFFALARDENGCPYYPHAHKFLAIEYTTFYKHINDIDGDVIWSRYMLPPDGYRYNYEFEEREDGLSCNYSVKGSHSYPGWVPAAEVPENFEVFDIKTDYNTVVALEPVADNSWTFIGSYEVDANDVIYLEDEWVDDESKIKEGYSVFREDDRKYSDERRNWYKSRKQYSSDHPFSIFVYEKPEVLVIVGQKDYSRPYYMYIKTEAPVFTAKYVKADGFCLCLGLPIVMKYIKEEN